MQNKSILVIILAFLLSLAPIQIQSISAITKTAPIIIDHTSIALFDQIPEQYLTAAKAQLKIAYGHTSHGSQIVSGIQYLSSQLGGNYQYTSVSGKCDSTSFLCDTYPSGDLGNPDRTKWSMLTRNMLGNGNPYNRNTIMWSWCGQADTTADNIKIYLDQMMQLDHDYPSVNFVYMTGHLTGSGTNGNLNQRNEQIRKYARDNNKILFDFADIESYDPAGNYYSTGSDACEWCSTWCSTHSEQCQNLPSCAHSNGFNCAQKGKAFWVMAAMLAGWNPNTSSNSTSNIESLGDRQFLDTTTANRLNQSVKNNSSLAGRLRGRMLLRVENRGEIWYISPTDSKKYQVTFANALYLFQNLALGISNDNLNKIQTPNMNTADDNAYGKKLAGHLLLQVEDHGRIWYVGQNGLRYEVTWDNLMNLFESLALGIADKDLVQISYGGLEKLK